MSCFIENLYSDIENIKLVEDGINTTYYFTVGDSSSLISGKQYVGKMYSSDILDLELYQGGIKIAQEYVHNTENFHVPKIFDTGVIENNVYMIYKFIDGQQLGFNQIYEQGTTEQYLSDIGKVMADLHQQENPVDCYGWYTYKDKTISVDNKYNDALDISMSHFNNILDEIERTSLNSTKINTIRSLFRTHLGKSNSDPVICHGDIKYNNIIESDDQLYLIDWEFVKSADPMYEYVKTERQTIGRYDQSKELSHKESEELHSILRQSYFESAPTEFNREIYLCYWILEYISCLNLCSDWYPEDELPDVRNYYLNGIKEIIGKLDD